MKNTYDDLDELLKDMRSDIEDTLMEEVLDEVKKILFRQALKVW